MIQYYPYPSLKKIMIQGLPVILANLGLTDFRVAAKKLRDSSLAPETEIIIQQTGGPVENKIRYEGFTITIWVTKTNENEAEIYADEISSLVESALTILPKVSVPSLKGINDIMVSSVEDEGFTQVRSIIGEAMLVPSLAIYN